MNFPTTHRTEDVSYEDLKNPGGSDRQRASISKFNLATPKNSYSEEPSLVRQHSFRFQSQQQSMGNSIIQRQNNYQLGTADQIEEGESTQRQLLETAERSPGPVSLRVIQEPEGLNQRGPEVHSSSRAEDAP